MRAVSYNGPAGRGLAVLRDGSDTEAVLVEPDGGGHATGSLGALIGAARRAGRPVHELLDELAQRSATSVTVDMRAATIGAGADAAPLAVPIDAPEIWAAGVSYLRSRHARELESAAQRADFYTRVYEAERPELFMKDSLCRRTVAPGVAVAVRGDSTWTVPEPELGLVLDADLTIVGYTIGNDVTARDIEGANPLYLPQSKIYARSCSLGPAVWLPRPGVAAEPFEVTLRIYSSAGELRYEGRTSTSNMRRSFDELASFLGRYNVVPDGTVLLTGTGVVPPEDFALAAGDRIEIDMPPIGTLVNDVIRLDASDERAATTEAPAGAGRHPDVSAPR